MIKISKAKSDAIPKVVAHYASVVEDMNNRGLYQWEKGIYPTLSILTNDIINENMFIISDDKLLLGSFVISEKPDDNYKKLPWLFGGKTLELHRIALHPDVQRKRLSKRIFDFVSETYTPLGFTSLRWDTSSQNERSLQMCNSYAERQAGICFIRNNVPFYCFEKRLSSDCPLNPIAMVPAFRHGSMTPWGGSSLKTLYNKDIPDDKTGESMEVSTIVGLESKDSTNTALSKLISLYGDSLLGSLSNANKVFPLLVKLLDAKELLSVQVHPNDNYANKHEKGKLGKEEAWVVLSCEEDAELIYGMCSNVTKEKLADVLRSGNSPEQLLRKVKVSPGDVLYIAPGTVHALGGGIVVYEIQQSSDVTYRMWDWNRKDANGNSRQLHIEDAIACTNTGEQISIGHISNEIGKHRIVNGKAFSLDAIQIKDSIKIEQDLNTFRLLTVFEDVTILLNSDSMDISKGTSVIIPASCPDILLQGKGLVLLSKPKMQ